MTTDEVQPYEGQLCSCGRPARVAWLTDRFGSVGYCGIPGRQPLNPHRCDVLFGEHDADYCAQLASHAAGGVS